jgi:hypothetical protein
VKARGLFNLIALIAFATLAVVSLILHSLTFFGRDPRELSQYLWNGFQFSSALALIVAILAFGISEKTQPVAQEWSLTQVLGLCFVLFIMYAAFNFIFTGSFLLHDANPMIVNGQYARGSHGMSTPISKEEFMKEMAYEARLHSGHWMAFFLFAVTALRWRNEKEKRLLKDR